MSDTSGPTYYKRRGHDERERAANATDRVARKIHLELAERYAALSRGKFKLPRWIR